MSPTTSAKEDRGKSFTISMPMNTTSNNGKSVTIDLFKSGSATPKMEAYKKFNDFFDNSDVKKKDVVFDLSYIKKKSANNGVNNYSTQDDYKNTSYSTLNKSREHSTNMNNYSSLSRSNLGVSLTPSIGGSNMNSKLKKEIESFR